MVDETKNWIDRYLDAVDERDGWERLTYIVFCFTFPWAFIVGFFLLLGYVNSLVK